MGKLAHVHAVLKLVFGRASPRGLHALAAKCCQCMLRTFIVRHAAAPKGQVIARRWWQRGENAANAIEITADVGPAVRASIFTSCAMRAGEACKCLLEANRDG